jgi:uncharacterized Zn finger protein
MKMKEEYQDKQGLDAEEIKRCVDDELKKARGDIAIVQKQFYRAGRIVTRASLGVAREDRRASAQVETTGPSDKGQRRILPCPA